MALQTTAATVGPAGLLWRLQVNTDTLDRNHPGALGASDGRIDRVMRSCPRSSRPG
jgi:hypothetical protein